MKGQNRQNSKMESDGLSAPGGLDAFRTEIDDIDNRISELIIRRLEVVRKVALYKKDNGIPITDAEREKEILSNRCIYSDEKVNTFISKFFKNLMELSKDFQRRL